MKATNQRTADENSTLTAAISAIASIAMIAGCATCAWHSAARTTARLQAIAVSSAEKQIEPGNRLARFLPALADVNGTDAHKGLGDDFTAA